MPAAWIEFAAAEGTCSFEDIGEIARNLAQEPPEDEITEKAPPPAFSEPQEDVLEPVEQYIRRLRSFFAAEETIAEIPKNRRMIVLIMYDIVDDRVRTRLAKYLEGKGLMRIQYSVFLGEIPRKTLPEIKDGLIRIQEIFEPTDSIIILPVTQDMIKEMHAIGKRIDLTYALMRIHTVVI